MGNILNIRSFLLTLLITFTAAQQTVAQIAPSAFRDAVIAAAKADNSAYDIEVTGQLTFTLDGNPADLNTGYAEYLRTPSELDSIVRKWVDLFAIADESPAYADLTKSLVVLVRNRAYIEAIPADAGPSKSPVWRPLAGDMIALLMVDNPTTRTTVTGDLLATSGLAADKAWRTAQDNSRAAMGSLQIGSYGPGGPIAITAASGLATSLLADPNACESGGPLAGAFVFVVDRDTFIIGRAEDPSTLGPFWDLTRKAVRSGNAASSTPMKCDAGKLIAAAIPG
jgi:hypothetical protein